MELSLDQAAFARALRLVGRVVPSRSTNSSALAILLEAAPGELRLTATDLEVTLSTTAPAETGDTLRLALPGRLLGEYVAQLPAGRLRLTAGGVKGRVGLECERFNAQLATLDAASFPRPAAFTAEAPLSLDAGRLRGAVERVAFAAARDTSRPVLTAVLFSFGAEGLMLTAADGFRLARAAAGGEAGPPRELLVPAGAVAELGHLLGESGAVRLHTEPEGKALRVEVGQTTLVTRLVEGHFPDVERVVPREWRTRLTVDLAAFRQAVRVAALFGEGAEARPVLLEASDGAVRLHAQGPQVGETRTELPASLEGEAQAVVLNTRLLGDILEAARGKDLHISWLSAQSPVVFRDGEGEGTADLWLAMPLHDPSLAHPAAAAA